jgi:universal stress protein E
MKSIRHILVISDPTVAGTPAISKATILAEKLGAKLELANDVKGTTADLIVKDTRHHSILERTVLTNDDWELIRHSPVPVLLAKERPWPSKPRVVAAVDPDRVNNKPRALDIEILEQASALATQLGGELHVLHAYLPASIVAAATAGESPVMPYVTTEELELERESKRKELAALASKYVDDAHAHLELGGPGQVVPQVAEQLHADIVVMGAVARSGLKRVFSGSTAEDVLEALPCDELVVHHET